MRTSLYLIVAASLALAGGCTPAQYAYQADRAAYATVSGAQRAALGEAPPFDVTYQPLGATESVGQEMILVGAKHVPIAAGKPVKLTLNECLEVAFRNSRSFQNEKELLYSRALALANSRREWNWTLLGGDVEGEFRHVRTSGDPTDTTVATASVGPTLTQRFIHGAQLTLGATLDLATDFSGIRGTTLGSLLEANVTQPLLRGGWHGFAYEEQYRLERDFLFAVYDYERFTQTFAVRILTDYYAVLRRRDTLENEKSNITRLKQTLAVTKHLVAGGDRSRAEQDEAEQNLLNARIRLERETANYRNALDRFKITLGLPITARMEVDYPVALTDLVKVGPRPVGVPEADAVAVALSTRPDVLTRNARVRDARRDVELAANDFLPILDLQLGINAPGTDPRQPFRTRFHKNTRTVNLQLFYEIDQTDHRDAYRNALIQQVREERGLAQFLDEVRLEVRRAYRTLLESRQTFQLQQRSVRIARRRRKLIVLRQKAGDAAADDVLRAEEALRAAQDGMTGALVNYTTTRLAFLADLGMLWVDERGLLHERTKPFRFDRVRELYPAVEPDAPAAEDN